MRIAIDLRPLQIGHQYRGIGAYLTNVLTRFPFDTSKHTFIFVRYDTNDPVKEFGLSAQKYEEVIVRKPEEAHGIGKVIALIKKRVSPPFGDLKQHNPDVYFQSDFLLGLPRGRMKKYVVMYDLIPLVLRDDYLPSWREKLTQPGLGKRRRMRIVLSTWLKEHGYKKALEGLSRADRILCISEATARDTHRLLGISKVKLRSIPLAASIPDGKMSDKHRPRDLDDLKNPYLLFIGGVDERRRLSDLIHAFNLLNGRGHTLDLVLSGKELADVKLLPNVEARNAILDSSYKDQIRLLGFTSQEEKAWLLKHAFAFVYPSTYEGFGLPVLEAMALGCPAITYDNSSLPEIAGKAAVLLKDMGGQAIRDAVIALRDDPKARKNLVEAGQKRAARFNWDKCAAETYKILTSR